MTRAEGIKFLQGLGWNEDGAEAIVDTAIEDKTFDGMTKEELKELSDDYKDR